MEIAKLPVKSDDVKPGSVFFWNNGLADDNHLEATIKVVSVNGNIVTGQIVAVHAAGYQIAMGGYNVNDTTDEIRIDALSYHCALSQAAFFGRQMVDKAVIWEDRYPYPAVQYAKTLRDTEDSEAAIKAALESGAYDDRIAA